MATYSQSTGRFTTDDGHSYTGYSGHGAGLNNPDKEFEKFVGPIPRGEYTVTDINTHKGPMTCVLKPDASNTMKGRNGFLIHGDNKKGDHSASQGCIVVGPQAREKIEVGDVIIVTD